MSPHLQLCGRGNKSKQNEEKEHETKKKTSVIGAYLSFSQLASHNYSQKIRIN